MTEQNFNQPSGSVMQFENPNHAKDLLENFFARTISEMHSMNYVSINIRKIANLERLTVLQCTVTRENCVLFLNCLPETNCEERISSRN